MGDVKARVAVVVALALGVSAATAVAVPHGAALRKFTYTASGTNIVNIPTGDLREHWKGQANPFGKINTRVNGTIQRPTPTTLTVQANMVIKDSDGDALKGACTGSGSLPIPDGAEDWTCKAMGGTGKFKDSRGQWKLHIDIHRVSNQDMSQSNRFDETGSGRISWNDTSRKGH
jgi:hypothetical protein